MKLRNYQTNLKQKQHSRVMDAIDARFKQISKVYHGPEGGKPAVKTWQDAREINPKITLNEVSQGVVQVEYST